MHRVVPELIVENYRAGRLGGNFPAIGMFLDLSGFSTMTDTLMQHGQHGAEVLASLMYGVFNPLVESIFEYGGKIVSFAGDGIMALYPIDDDERSTALRALTSAWIVQQKLQENPDRKTIYGKFTFSAKIGLAIGSVTWRILLSDNGENATYYFRGVAVDDSAKAEHQAKSGEIILSQRLNELLEEDIRSRPNNTEDAFHRFMRFRVEMPKGLTNDFPPVDLDISRIFMPEEVILEGIRGEFRQIANLFIRIPDIPDDELKNFVNEIFELKKRYGGLVTRLDFGDKGCNMLLLWGAPVTFENDIGRTMNFILDLRARVKVPITAGVTYYIAHAGYLGSDLCEDYTCYGWGVNLAARFMMSAPDGEIWVDDRIAQRVSHRFAMDYVGSQRFKGFAAEQKVYSLRYRKTESDVAYHGDMVGRKNELSSLKKFVEPLWQGNFAGVVTVSGEAGIGKGRLVYEFASSDIHSKNNVYWANCKANQILQQSFNPIKRWLLRYFSIQPDQSTDEKKATFNSKLDDLIASTPDPELARELDRTRSVLGALIDLRWDESLYETLDAEGKYNNTLISLVSLFKAKSLIQPVILFLDDIQFIDDDTEVFLKQLKRSILSANGAFPLAIILTLRTQSEPFPLVDEFSDSNILLAGVNRQAIERLSENILGGPVSPDLLMLILSRSEGNPYFAEQVIRYLQDEEQLEQTDKGWARTELVRETVLPGDIRALLVARLDKLQRDVKSTVHTASVLGREFDFGVLAQMLGSEVTTKANVNEAEKAIVLSHLSEMRYMFYHGLLRDAAYSMQMRARRQELHILALNALEIMYEDEPERYYAEFAYHAEHGNVRSKAHRYYMLAGDIASDQYQNAQAIKYFTKALSFTASDNLDAQFDILSKRVDLYSRTGDRNSQLNDLTSMDGYAEQLDDSVLRANVKMLQSKYYYTISDFAESIKYAEQANVYLLEESDSNIQLETQMTWAPALLRVGKSDEAMKQARRGLDLVKEAGDREGEAKALTVMGLIALEQEDPGISHTYLEEALFAARETKNRRLELACLGNLAISEGSVKGNYAVADDLYRQAYEVAKEIGDRYAEGIQLANLGFSAGRQGDLEAAFTHHENALNVAREVGNISQEVYTLINLSAVAGIKNDASKALSYAEQANVLSKKLHDRSAEAWCMLYMGHAYLLMDEYENALATYRNSIVIRDELGQPSLAIEPMGGLVETALKMNDLVLAGQEAEKILVHLDDGGVLDGTEEPLRIYYACYLYFSQQKDPRAQQILDKANDLLNTQVSSFKNERSRELFVKNFPWRYAIQKASDA